MYSKPCLTHVDDGNRLIYHQEAILYWIFMEVSVLNAPGTLTIYDGWDAAGVEKFRLIAGYSRIYSFYPPFICNDALYIAVDEHVNSYSLGFLPVKVVFPERYKVAPPE
ncbi:unnamed protein product [marine sediment metagenome]|uniref:Uncharacterized protein n=1 Tax=marine sediment metagenome TaxID=412755 RepID=X1SKL3_9ZZZZ